MKRNKFLVLGIWVTEFSPLFACRGMCEERELGFLSVL
jgi:hypothetical protein